MKRSPANNAFALAVTLVLMAFIVVVIVAYLANTRTDRATSSVYANTLRSRGMAESGLAAATQLLRNNTRYGNYVTAMPASSPAPTSIYTEIYRPTDRTAPNATKAGDYLTFLNAGGDLLVSLAASPTPTPTATPFQVDPRPTANMVYASPSPTPLPVFALPSPSQGLVEEKLPPQVSPTPTGNSYNFNQVTRLAGSSNGRQVDPNGLPACGQWIRVRDTTGTLIGRYAFYIEDDSMKVNINASGNNLALPSPTASPNLRVNDFAVPAATPASQIQEIDPTAVLLAANRSAANAALIATGGSSRLPSTSTLALLSNWLTPERYTHLLTTLSKDDNTTAQGWQRLDLNALVASAPDNAAKVTLATKMANWIRDAWTGTTALGSLQYSQLFNDSRLRLQVAANIIDYIDTDNTPTDLGNVVPTGFTDAVPVLGIEKIPHLAAVEILYQASNSNYAGIPGTYSATLKMKLQFRFLNLFDTPLDPADFIGRIEVTGVPIISKNGLPVFSVETQTYSVALAALRPAATGTGSCSTAGLCTVPAGVDGTSSSGAKTLQTDWLTTQTVPFTVVGNDQNPIFLAGSVVVKAFGKNNERLDETTIGTLSPSIGYKNSGSNSIGDFLKDSTTATLQVASINVAYGNNGTAQAGDPRYRGQLANDRWRNLTRTDASTPSGWTQTDRITAFVDIAEINTRSFGFDWYDESADRPLAVIRNGAMVNIGELGHIATTEYQWRTLYLQHPERPTNTRQPGPKDDVPLRRTQAQDYVLLDLFRVGGANVRSGAININTQQKFIQVGGTISTLPLQSLFIGLPVGTPAPTILTQAAPAAPSPSPADRLSTSVNLVMNFMTVAPPSGQAIGTVPVPYRVLSVSNKRNTLVGETATPDNNPTRPYFLSSGVASTLSRLIGGSESSDTSTSSSRSKIVYSALRTDPTSTTTIQNYRKDYQVEQAFREISNSITTRGNVFRVLYVGQAIRDSNKNDVVDTQSEVQGEYLGEMYLERISNFAPAGGNPDAVGVSDSTYKVIANRAITE